MTRRPPETPSSQSERFERVAREIGCDEDEAAFKARLGKLLSAPVKKPPAAPAKPEKPKLHK
jgi:hypothetical protein